jgi:stearoyl-CoA desaturase (Delta-9 desaturase)
MLHIKENNLAKHFHKIIRWFDSYSANNAAIEKHPDRIELLRILPFLLIHVGCLGVIWVGWSLFAVTFALILYLVRMFAITGFYHRYFSHRTYKTNRVVQFLFAVAGATACQRGALWWAGHHRHHHRVVDTPDDPHSPVIHGFFYSHVIWFLTNKNFKTRHQFVRDWNKYPELVWLDRFDSFIPIVFASAVTVFGYAVGTLFPATGTSGMQMFVWGFCISTVLLYNGTWTINSLSHLYGYRRYDTPDHSRNNPVLAVITLGEGWHNNHHRYAVSARQGFARNEIDITWLILRGMEKTGLVQDLRPVPESIFREAVSS